MLNFCNLALLAQAESAQTIGSAAEWWATGIGAVLLLAGLGLFTYATRAGIIARATTKEATRQPLFLLVLTIALFVLVLNTFLPFFSLGDDVKMLKDCGLATLLIGGLILAVWTSSTSIADEIEGKTAMTLLSKPINRRQFVVGKYFGILQSILWLLIPLAVCFLLLIYFKVGYDARESSKAVPPPLVWQSVGWLPFVVPMPSPERLSSVLQIVPGLVLIFLEIAILTAVSVAISTRVPMIVNMVTCITIFVIGHLTPVLVKVDTQNAQLVVVQFTARLIATVLPSLEIFNTQAAVATGAVVPPAYLGVSMLYCAAYCTAAILLAFILFEDRDLA